MSYDEPIEIDRSVPLECIDASKVWEGATPRLIDECLQASGLPSNWVSDDQLVLPLTHTVEREIREWAYNFDRSGKLPYSVIVAIFAKRRDGMHYVFVLNNIAPEKVIADITRIMKLKVFL